MKYLITGGCGFLGSNIANAVIEQNRGELIVLDNLSRGGSQVNLEWLRNRGAFTYYHADIRNLNDVARVIRDVRPDVLFHLAGQVAMTTSIANTRMDFEINALGTLNVLESVREYAPECIVLYSSTNKVYGDLEYLEYKETPSRYYVPEYPAGFPETMQLDFHSPYGCSKGAADQYVLDFSRMFGLKTVVFRHSSMFGGRQFSTYDQGWIGWFCSKALEIRNAALKEPFTISGNGKQVRDVLYSDDMVSLYFKTVENIDRAKGCAFNIGGGMENSLSLLELFSLLEKELDIRMQYQVLPPRESDQRVFVADISRIEQLTGWKPVVDKASGIRRMLEWVSSNA